MQATVGSLVAKTLTSSTSNPYAAAGQAARTTTPTALDAFSVQARPTVNTASVPDNWLHHLAVLMC